MRTVLRIVGKIGAAIVPLSQLALLGLPAIVALECLVAFLAVAVLNWLGWVLKDDDRSRRLTQLLSAVPGRHRDRERRKAVKS
jgi:hypothetical protein